MIVISSVPCEANIIRGQLKHSWLEHQLCSRNISADDVVAIWKERNWQALDKEFDIRVSQAVQLVDGLEEGFSPAQLVDRLTPFAGLSEKLKGRIKEVVHAAYLESSNILDLKEPLSKAALALGKAIKELRVVWHEPKTEEGEIRLRQAWGEVSKQAHALLAVLERLPKGVVLP